MSSGRLAAFELRLDHFDAASSVGEVTLHSNDRVVIGLMSRGIFADLGTQTSQLSFEIFDPRLEPAEAHFKSLDAQFERGEADVHTPQHRLDRVQTIIDNGKFLHDDVAKVDQDFEDFVGGSGLLRLHRFHLGTGFATIDADGKSRRSDIVLGRAEHGPGT